MSQTPLFEKAKGSTVLYSLLSKLLNMYNYTQNYDLSSGVGISICSVSIQLDFQHNRFVLFFQYEEIMPYYLLELRSALLQILHDG